MPDVPPAGSAYATVETKANFARPITKDSGRVRAEARVVVKGRQIVSAEAKVVSVDGAPGPDLLFERLMQVGSFQIRKRKQ